MDTRIIAFTDGAARGNPGPGGYAAIIVAKNKVQEIGGREVHTTNNRMELKGAIEALVWIKENVTLTKEDRIAVHTDSRYLIQGITKWVFGWQKNNWQTAQKTETLNRDLWESLINRVDSIGTHIDWEYVSGHVGIPANERADEIATSFADQKPIELYKGDANTYAVDITILKADDEKTKSKSRSKNRSQAKAYSYISMVNGEIKTHSSWNECETRVKGKSGARFKKALSASEEKDIIDNFKK